jgi:hypothetical protein
VRTNFDSMLTAELLDEASSSYVRQYLFKRYGRWLMVACIVNAAGFSLALWLGAMHGPEIAVFGLVVLFGPAYLLSAYFFYPRSIAKRLKQRFLPITRYSVTSTAVEVTTKAGNLSRPWPRLKPVLEFPSFFILCFSPLLFFFIVVPKIALTSEALSILNERCARHVA